MLVDPENGDFRLQPGSPAVGQGCQTFVDAAQVAAVVGRVFDQQSVPPSIRRHDARRPLVQDVAGDCAGEITGDIVWDADTVRVHGDVTVRDGATLTILAGTLVEFQDWYALTVRGRLLALGEAGAPVRFDSDEPWAFAFDSTAAGSWAGIRFPFTRETNAASRLQYCVIEHAKCAGDSSRGGALQVNGFGKLQVVNSILRANAADFGGAIACTHYASPEITGCLIVANVAFAGGAALHCLDAYPRLVHCTVVANEDRNAAIFDPAAAIYGHQSKPRFTGGILRDNISQYYEPTQILYGKSYYTTYSDIGNGWSGEGVIDADPGFLGAGDQPFALAATSPCVDAALPDTTGLGLPPFDLAGSPRIWNGRGDMGAYEWSPATAVPAAIPAMSWLSRPSSRFMMRGALASTAAKPTSRTGITGYSNPGVMPSGSCSPLSLSRLITATPVIPWKARLPKVPLSTGVSCSTSMSTRIRTPP